MLSSNSLNKKQYINTLALVLGLGAGLSVGSITAQNNIGTPATTTTKTTTTTATAKVFVLDVLKPDPKDRDLCLELKSTVLRHHYKKDSVEHNSMAKLLFNSFFENMDFQRNIFLSSEINHFKQRYLARMPELVRDCDLGMPYTTFNQYRRSALARLAKIQKELPAMIAQFDFNKDEYWVSDPKKSQSNWPKDTVAADDLWRKNIKHQVIALRLDDKSNEDIIKTIKKRIETQERNLQKIYSSDVFSLYMNTYLRLFDWHTNYLPPAKSEDFNINMRLSLDGIGAMLTQEGEYTKVTNVLVGGPASKQTDLKAGDLIIGVAQKIQGEFEDVIGWRLDKVIQKIRGPRHSVVRLRILDTKDMPLELAKDIAITRDKIKLEQQAAKKSIVVVEYLDQVYKIGVISLPSFYLDFDAQRRRERDYRSSTRDVARLLAELDQENINGLIFDLRHNSGGSLVEANNLTGMFIEQGPSVQVKNSNGRIQRYGKFRRSPYYKKGMAVLINRASASASEIFAAAIQDHSRGIVIGTNSYGKGTVQSLHKLSRGQIKITDAKFYRISGGSTQRLGVIPDIAFPPVYDAKTIGENILDLSLQWDQITPVRHRHYYNIDPILDDLKQRHKNRTQTHPNFLYLKERTKYWEQKRINNQKVTLMLDRRKKQIEYEKQEIEFLKKIRKLKSIPAGITDLKAFINSQSTPNTSTNTSTDTSAQLSAIASNKPNIMAHNKTQNNPISSTSTSASTPTSTSSNTSNASNTGATAAIATVSTNTTTADSSVAQSSALQKNKEEFSEDPFLIESALILLDSMYLTSTGIFASTDIKTNNNLQ